MKDIFNDPECNSELYNQSSSLYFGGGNQELDSSVNGVDPGIYSQYQQEDVQPSVLSQYISGYSPLNDPPLVLEEEDSNYSISSSSSDLNSSHKENQQRRKPNSKKPKEKKPKTLCQKSKRIKKEKLPLKLKPSKPNNKKTLVQAPTPRLNRPLPKRIKERRDAGHLPFTEAFKYANPGKNTPKRVSIFLRKRLQKLGFDIKKIDNKRVRPGYLHTCFLHLSNKLTSHDFHFLMQEFRQWLQAQASYEQSLYENYGDEVSLRYVQDLQLAAKASVAYEEKKLLDSFKIFLGDGKEQLYRGQNMIMYIEEVRKIFIEKKVNFPIPSEAELIKINERSIWSLEKIVKKIEQLQNQEFGLFDVMDLD